MNYSYGKYGSYEVSKSSFKYYGLLRLYLKTLFITSMQQMHLMYHYYKF